MIGSAMTAAVSAKAEHDAFEQTISVMPPELRDEARSQRAQMIREMTANRRITEEKPNATGGLLGFFIGLIIGSST